MLYCISYLNCNTFVFILAYFIILHDFTLLHFIIPLHIITMSFHATLYCTESYIIHAMTIDAVLTLV